jgi:hypothetical protein
MLKVASALRFRRPFIGSEWKRLSIGCNTAKWSCKHTKIYYDGRKKLNLNNANVTGKIAFIQVSYV